MDIQKSIDFVFLHLLFLFFSIISVIAKMASRHEFLSKEFISLYLLEIVMMVIYSFFWQKVVKRFTLISAYLNKSIVILWVMLWSVIIFKETISINNIFGVLIIIVGIIMVVKDDDK